MRCLFATDLHGHVDRYRSLFEAISAEVPEVVLLGGDLLPHPMADLSSLPPEHRDFVHGFLAGQLSRLRERMGSSYPEVLLILGNDDGRAVEGSFLHVAASGLWTYIHDRRVQLGGVSFYGYAFVPPTPFLLKDWERYDVSRFVDPGCIPPEGGSRSVPVSDDEARYRTIKDDLDGLAGEGDLSTAVFLFHSPPYGGHLDRAALDGKMVDHAPLDVHVGSIAIERFIEARQPLVTLHGHVHESARLTGAWRERSGRTHMFSAAHDGPELALVRFDTDCPEEADRSLL